MWCASDKSTEKAGRGLSPHNWQTPLYSFFKDVIIETSYTYDSENKVYKRIVNDVPHKDYVTGKQYTAKNIIVYQVRNHTLAGDDKGRQDIENLGEGEGY